MTPAPEIFEPVIYRMDASDCIIYVNDTWDRFALENRSEHLVSGIVIGQSIWNFIADYETKHIYRLLFEKVRSTHAPVTIAYRCDAPERRRYMEMVITCSTPGVIEISSRVIRIEDRMPVLTLPGDERERAWITLCSWCKRARTEGGWLELETAIPVLDPFNNHPFAAVTHGVCPDCQKSFENELLDLGLVS